MSFDLNKLPEPVDEMVRPKSHTPFLDKAAQLNGYKNWVHYTQRAEMTDSSVAAMVALAHSPLHAQPEPDGFTHESPIRAFTSWAVTGRYAIGKGFRPSLQHLTVYLDAMERLEGWALLQVLEAASGSPSFVFRRSDVREVRCFLSDFVACTDLSEPAADGGITVGMVFQQHAESLLKSRMGL